jgi:hypothetical protein
MRSYDWVYLGGNYDMNIRILVALGLGLIAASALAQPLTYNYAFTPELGPPSFTLSNAYIFDTETSLAYTAPFPLQGTFAPGVEVNGSLTFDLPFGPQLLNFISVFTDSSGNVGVAISLPTALASTLIANNTSWDQFNLTYVAPYVVLPNEVTTVADLESGIGYSNLTPSFAAQPPLTSPILSLFGTQTIVAFDGATLGGTFEYQPAPEPSSLALGALVIALLRRQSMSGKIGRKQ